MTSLRPNGRKSAPSLAKVLRAAYVSSTDYQALRRSGRIEQWPSAPSEGFAVCIGLFRAFRGCGFSLSKAVASAENIQKMKCAPQCLVINPFTQRVAVFDRGTMNNKSFSELRRMLADPPLVTALKDGALKEATSDGPPSIVFIDVEGVIARMKCLFRVSKKSSEHSLESQS